MDIFASVVPSNRCAFLAILNRGSSVILKVTHYPAAFRTEREIKITRCNAETSLRFCLGAETRSLQSVFLNTTNYAHE
jgi:hypothetical protein